MTKWTKLDNMEIKETRVTPQKTNETEKEYTFDLLCFDTKGDAPFSNSATKLINFISSNYKIFGEKELVVKESMLATTDNFLSINIKPIADELNTTSFFIHVIFKLSGDDLNKPSDQLKFVSNFRKDLVFFLVESGKITKIYITKDDFSKRALNFIYPKFYTIENLLRSYIIKHLSRKEGVNYWFNNSISSEVKEKIRSRKETTFSELCDGGFIDTKISLIDFEDLGSIVYENSSGNLKYDDLIKKIQDSSDLTNLKNETKRNIDKHFEGFKDKNFQEEWQKLKEYRNKIAHNRFTDLEETLSVLECTRKMTIFLNEKDNSLIEIDQIYFSDIEKIDYQNDNNYHPYQKISRPELIKELSDYDKWCKKNGMGFLGLKNFLHNWIGSKDYDIKSAWDLLDILATEGCLKIEYWKDTTKKYPDQKEIRLDSKFYSLVGS